jgi:hypothetical protein
LSLWKLPEGFTGQYSERSTQFPKRLLHYRREITHFPKGMDFARFSIELVTSPVEAFRETGSTVLLYRPGGRCAYAPSLHQRVRSARLS